MQTQIADRAADAGAAISTAAVGFLWLSAANELAHFVATIVAIISGLLAGAWHVHRLAKSIKEDKKSEDEEQ